MLAFVGFNRKNREYERLERKLMNRCVASAKQKNSSFAPRRASSLVSNSPPLMFGSSPDPQRMMRSVRYRADLLRVSRVSAGNGYRPLPLSGMRLSGSRLHAGRNNTARSRLLRAGELPCM